MPGEGLYTPPEGIDEEEDDVEDNKSVADEHGAPSMVIGQKRKGKEKEKRSRGHMPLFYSLPIHCLFAAHSLPIRCLFTAYSSD
jgi:hypothetical protein